MATKRSPPKDLDVPSLQVKQPRLDIHVPSQTPLFTAKPRNVMSRVSKGSSTSELSFSTHLLNTTPSLSVSPTHSGKTSFDFHTKVGTSLSTLIPPTQKSSVMTHTSSQATSVLPPIVVPISVNQHRNVPHLQFVQSGPIRTPLTSSDVTAIVSHSPFMSASSSAVVTPHILPSPPPPYFTTPGTTPNGSGLIPDQITGELPSGLESSSELVCSSPSQFLHPPTSVCVSSSALLCSSTSSSELSSITQNRQPFCLSEKLPFSGKDGLSIERMMKMKVLKYRRAKLASLKLKHEVELKEKFFLEAGGNMMDIVTWKKRPNIKRDKYLKHYDIDSETLCYDRAIVTDFHSSEDISTRTVNEDIKLERPKSLKSDTVIQNRNDTNHGKLHSVSKLKLEEPEETSVTSTTVQIPLSTVSPSLRGGTPSSPLKTPQFPTCTTSPRHGTRLHSSFSSIYETSHEDIVMRARHEAEVMRAISELRKEGLWSASRLPKVQEPQRSKTHWDYLLEEMQWLATDFSNERRWKMNAAKKISRSVSGYYRELEMQQVRTEKEEALKLRKVASSIAKEVKHFWDSIQKVVEHKQQILLEEKRKKAMDMHLEYIVDQTAKYSNWLVKGLTTASSTASPPSEPSLHSAASTCIDDSDAFLTPEETSDDEETIENEELQMENENEKPNFSTEIQTLQEEGEIPLEQLLASLPPEILNEDPCLPHKVEISKSKEIVTSENKIDVKGSESNEDEHRKKSFTPEVEEKVTQKRRSHWKLYNEDGDLNESGNRSEVFSDAEYNGNEEEVEDETTISEQELHEGDVDRSDELDTLILEGALPLEDLLKMYNLEQPSSKRMTGNHSGEEESEDVSMDRERKMSCTSNSSQDSGDEGNFDASSEEDEVKYGKEWDGLEFLVSGKSIEEVCQTEAGLSDVAAVAEQFQPKGITLATTEVKTKVPFLLRHELREYQHIGLDWLVAMHEKRLNGILADEMGLGKTIQTIALLAHLACEKANWGPHLIVVPTSVMLNWEYELKKWCPAFKILTYFGSFKERKQKRVGWTKRNAFHVCITSYNIAVTDHRAFKQMKWKYLILDEAQNIKNFKSQRWQTLLTFNSQRRLLLTGTPLQNNLMELWSLMHFLMPTVFSSHSDFREWFSNPLTGMVEGSQEYNESIVKRLHQVLRPFLLRRLKMEVEKQMPKKYEHVILCRISKRQRFLYDEYMSRRKTKATLTAGNYLSVINILMQLRKVCNHPDLFEPRPILSPLRLTALEFYTPTLLFTVVQKEPFKHVNLDHLNLQLASYELGTEAFAAFRSRQLQTPKALIFDPTHSQVDMREDVEEDELGKSSNSFLVDLHLADLDCSRQDWAHSRRKHMHEVISRRCRKIPMYGLDLVKSVRRICSSNASFSCPTKSHQTWCISQSHWLWSGYVACLQHQIRTLGWDEYLPALKSLIPTYEKKALELEEILKRFIITVPPVTASPITLHTYLHTPTTLSHDMQLVQQITAVLSPRSNLFHCSSTCLSLQFPETRLIQYDCGKLQTLDALLRGLKTESHRVLIFTQMSRVLDILEIFLNYHGHTYLRLDGTTPVQKRQALMDRFNHDERIFCFILSTRSGGLGVNLTGADTVIFYDSDWNPTMDAQAQDRCHRIGQTRDVHIYRLVCESTVEENILKKANQKRMLGNIAIEGGVFTTDFFKEASLRDLFKVKPDVQSVEHDPAVDQQSEALTFSPKHLEDLLMQAEDENDAQAASKAKAEQVAEKAEFDEGFCAQMDEEQTSDSHSYLEFCNKALNEFAVIESQLSGVERYAMRYLEEKNAKFAAKQLKIAEDSIEQAKKSWEFSHLQSLREEEERIADDDVEDDMLLTYDRPELANKIFFDKDTGEGMPIWLPPTPPAESTDDVYVDLVLDIAYDTSTTISPAELAFIAPFSEEDYDVLGLSRRCPEIEPIKSTQKTSSKQTLKEHVNVPPSLFWRRYSTDTLSTKLKKLASHQKKLKTKDQFTPLLEQQPEGPTWSHFEDWLLLKGIIEVLEFPLSLAITVPAQMPNWSIIADFISLLSKVRRSPLQCREHLMNIVIPREDSSVKSDDSVESKKHKTKDSVSKKSRSRKDHKTKHFILGDGGKEQSTLFAISFDRVLEATTRRKQATKFTLDSVQKPSTHADLLKEYGVQIEAVLSPVQIAHQRAERIQSELPRHSSQVHQLLAQPYHFSLMRGYAAAAAAGTPFIKTQATGYNLPRQVPSSVAISTAPSQRFQPVSSAITSFTSSQLPQVSSTVIPSPVILPTASLATPSPPATAQPSTPSPLVPAKAFSVTTNVSDISKTLRGNITHQQLLLLRQSTLQQQANVNRPQSSTQLTRPLIAQQQTTPTPQTPSTTVAQKVTLPSGIEQLRASIALSPQQRFAAITSVSSNSASRGLAAGRTLQTEDVLALLKQQSLRIATQSYKTGHAVPSQLHPQTHFHFRQEPSHLSAKIQQLPSTVLPLEAVKLATTPTTSTTSLTDVVQAPHKTDTVEQSHGGASVLVRQQSQTQSLSMPMQFSAPSITTVPSLPLGTHPQISSSVNTTATQNLVKAQMQQVISQQHVTKTTQGIQLPKSTA